ncbi:transporter substrate-binding domain-containing protein [Accumulibacter sp.]|uniref:transporter substrate-binding domain-containing protein n=1 Tax=Accumulibacter sp. TaxID=2053492 RepID=UPI0028C4BBF0|nr:transporter substrate-binding domain-containing protein [Accumulibacter sp.]
MHLIFRCLAIIWLLLPLGASAADAASGLAFSAEERAWLAEHPVIRMGIDAGYGPYTFLDESGQVRGVAVDFMAEIEARLGIRFEFVSDLSWPQLMAAVRERRLDAVATVAHLPERDAFLAFSAPYLTTPLVIVTRSDTPQLHSLRDLEPLRLALVEGYSSSRKVIDEYPKLRPRLVATPLDGLRAVASGAADAYVGVIGVNIFLAAQNGITNLKVNAAFDMAENNQCFGVRKDWPQLAQLLDKAFAAIPAQRRNAIFQRWLPQQADEIVRLSEPRLIARLFPWSLGALALAVSAYLLILFWNVQLKRELARRQHELADSNARLKASVALAHLGHWEFRVADQHIQWADETYRIFGLEPQSVQMTYDQLIALVHPDDRERHEAYLKRMLASRPGEDLGELRYRLLRSDGSVREVSVRVDIEHDQSGRARRLFGAIQDISERVDKAAELERIHSVLEALVEGSSDAIFVKDEQGRYIVGNRALAELVGRPQAEVLGTDDFALFPSTVAERFRADDQRIMARGKVESYEETVVIASSGEIVATAGKSMAFLTTKGPLIIHGEVRGVFGIARDVSLLKAAQTDLAHARDELEERVEERTRQLAELNKELESFAYAVAHDLKAPLRGMAGYCHMLAEDYGEQIDAGGRQFIAHIAHGVAQMSELIDGLLSYARMERRDLHCVAVDVRPLVDKALADLQGEVDRQGAKVSIDFDHLVAHADPDGLLVVLRNLIDNALKFSCDGQPPLIGISGQRSGNQVKLAITDNGIGFDMRFHDRIFEIFQRLQRSESYPGTGVGLALVRKAMQRMAGRVWAESTPGRGTVFFLELSDDKPSAGEG